MTEHRHSELHNRLYGLARLIRKMVCEADKPGFQMSKRERADLNHILSVMNTMLAEDCRNEDNNGTGDMPVKHSNQYLNTQCEFFDLDANRIQCAIGCDMFHCSKNCIYATNVPGALPPYGTKYMKGWIER